MPFLFDVKHPFYSVFASRNDEIPSNLLSDPSHKAEGELPKPSDNAVPATLDEY
ncbi:predicted protein [Botrytis cinerea T4]|uniref:Uncharacterized protein n=1 Tax=Botryotinia fuckeliana (strain T4) TaxID=999810 RepID=G2YZJ5_BOTF4|nr:predicted protein [Botrytis cinerea T4]